MVTADSWFHSCSVNGFTEIFFSSICDWCGTAQLLNDASPLTEQKVGDRVLESMFIEVPSEGPRENGGLIRTVPALPELDR